MIKFGDINIVGVFLGDTPITSAYYGGDIIYSSKPKYPENLLIFQYWLRKMNKVYLPVWNLGVCNIDWGDGTIERDVNIEGLNISHLYNPADGYIGFVNVIITIKLKPTAADYGIRLRYTVSYNNLANIISAPSLYPFPTYRCLEMKTQSGSKYPDYQPNLSIIGDDYTTDDWALIVVNNLGDTPHNELTVGSFKNANGLIVGTMGLYKKIIFKPNFKLKDGASGNHITLYENCQLNEIVGNIDYSNCMEVSSDFLLLYNKDYIHKIGIIKLANVPADKTIWKIDTKNTILNNLVNFEIANLGQFVNQGMTYDFTGLDAWGDENKAATLGVTGSRQSLLDTLVNNSYDVNGKDVTLKLHKSVLARLSKQAIAAIEAKGYKVPLYDPNSFVLKAHITNGHNRVLVPINNFGNYKTDWGDGTINTTDYHVYNNLGDYTIVLTPDNELSKDAEIGYGGNSVEAIKEVIQIPASYKMSEVKIGLANPNDYYRNYGKLQPNLEVAGGTIIPNTVIGMTIRGSAIETAYNKRLLVKPVKCRLRLYVSGYYEEIRFDDNFKAYSDQINSIIGFKRYIHNYPLECNIHKIVGNFNLKDITRLYNSIFEYSVNDQKGYSDYSKLYYIEKISLPESTKNTDHTLRLFANEEKNVNLVYLYITNLGDTTEPTFTYDFSMVPNWGDDAFAESVGITGAKDSLIRTINSAVDVHGKNITIKFSSGTLSRLTDEELKPLWDKGYTIEGRENPFKPIITWSNGVTNNKYNTEGKGGTTETINITLKRVHNFTIKTCLDGIRLGSQREESIKSYIDEVLLTSIVDPHQNSLICDSASYTINDDLEHIIRVEIDFGRFVNQSIEASIDLYNIS